MPIKFADPKYYEHSKVTGFLERVNPKTRKFINWKHDHNNPRNKKQLKINAAEDALRAYKESIFD